MRDALSPMGKHSVCAEGLQTLVGFIHNRQHIKQNECPDKGTFVGASDETPFGDEERDSVTKNLMPLLRGFP
jgi:hypothetical protein